MSIIDLTGGEEEGRRFWEGAILLTRPRGVEPAEHFITFAELVEHGAKQVLSSSYCIDFEWLMEQIEAPEVILVTHWDRSGGKAGTVTKHLAHSKQNVHLVYPPFPSFPNYGVMHTKLMLILHADRLRIVVSTANLVEYDYDEIQNVRMRSVAV